MVSVIAGAKLADFYQSRFNTKIIIISDAKIVRSVRNMHDTVHIVNVYNVRLFSSVSWLLIPCAVNFIREFC